jgi:hypothetical protein
MRKAGIILLGVAILAPAAYPPRKAPSWKKDEKTGGWGLYRAGGRSPMLVLHNPQDARPFIHPIMAPDGKGVLTECSPAHHKHQTGLFFGFLQVNGRDYFNNRGADYYLGDSDSEFQVLSDGEGYAPLQRIWLDRAGKWLLEERQAWWFEDWGDHYVFTLQWVGSAYQDLTFGKHDYGGLFLRMPWRPKTGGKAVNSEGDENAKAEGKRARWVDVGMPIEGRKDWGHVAILDSKHNFRHPTPWRVDGQLGVGPAPSRAGEWKLKKKERVQLCYALVVYTGDLNKKLIESVYNDFPREDK